MKQIISLSAIFSVLVTAIAFALPVSAADSFGALSISKTANGYLVEASGTAAAEGSYWIMAASYNKAAKTLANIKVAEAAGPAEGGEATLSAAFSTADIKGDETRFMLWKNDGSFKPLAEAVTLDAAAGYTELTEIAQGMPVGVTTAELCGTNPDSLVDGDATTAVWTAEKALMYVDLGRPMPVEMIEILTYREVQPASASFDVYLTNEIPTLETAADKKVKLGTTHEQATTAEGYQALAGGGQSYRYVSLEKFGDDVDTENQAHHMLVYDLKVYTKAANLVPMTEVAAGKPNGMHGTTGLDEQIEALTDGDDTTYEFIYNSAGNLYVDLGLACKIDHIEVLAYQENTNISFRTTYYDLYLTNELPTADTAADKKALVASIPYGDGANTAAEGRQTYYPTSDVQQTPYRFVSLEKFHSTHGLMINEVKVYVRTADLPQLVEVAAGKGGTENGIGTWDFSLDTNYTESNNWPISNLTDGDENTQWAVHGGGSHAMGWIDLGAQYKIHHVEVLAYNAVDPGRGANFDIALSNVVPTSADTEASYTAAKLTLGTMPYRENRVDAATGYDSFTVDYTAAGADAEGYRYVCLEELTDGIMYVAEVKVYVLEADLPASSS